jgi:RNA polymerase-binding transcription factor DksA
LRELEAELRRELTALERRLASERQAESTDPIGVAAGGAPVATLRMSDTDLRRDLVAAALARLEAGDYGTCSHCGEPIPFGRLLVMPEATHCLGCSGRS